MVRVWGFYWDTHLDSSTAWETRGSSRSGGALGDKTQTTELLKSLSTKDFKICNRFQFIPLSPVQYTCLTSLYLIQSYKNTYLYRFNVVLCMCLLSLFICALLQAVFPPLSGTVKN